MGRPQQAETTSPGELTLRAWEDMCDEVLRELQEGAAVPDSLVDTTASLVQLIRSWKSGKGPLAAQLPSALNQLNGGL
jgi:hypothetical protein